MKPEYFSPVLASGKEDIGRIAQTLADRMNAYLVETFGSPEEGKAACRGEALDFLNTLDPEATKYDFWVLTPDGSKNPKPVPHHRIGTLDKWFDWMWGMNRAGGGVFVTVHASDGRGRKTENITRPRAIIADFDKGIPPSVPLVPNIVVSSSEGKAHDYWLIDPSTAPSVSDWQPIEDAWVNGLGGDQNARDAARILRLPGFFHVKDQENPQLVTAQYLREDPYTWAELVAAAPKAQQAQQNPKNATGAATGAPGHHWQGNADRPIGLWIFEEKVAQYGHRLRTGEERRALLTKYIASKSSRGESFEEIVSMVDLVESKYFDPSDPRDYENINDLIYWATKKDYIKREAHAAVALPGFVGPAPTWTQPGYTTDAPPGYPHKWTDPETGETGFYDNDGNRYRTPEEQEADRQERLARHELAQFVTIDAKPKQPVWVIRGFLPDGVTVISGSGGVGKSTVILPLSLTAAGLHGDESMMPRHWRHVVYVSEDIAQAQRILAGVVTHGGLGIRLQDVQERVHLVPAVRLHPSIVVQVGELYKKQFTRMVGDVAVLPLIVFDTKSAVFELESENDNSEVSRMVAAIKQHFHGLPCWMIAHIAKPGIGRTDVKELSSRGASALTDDANGTAFLVKEEKDERRYLILGKRRFEPNWNELEVTSHTATMDAPDEYGVMSPLTLRWAIAAPPAQSRKEAAKEAQEAAQNAEAMLLRHEVRDAIETAWVLGNPLSRNGVRSKVKRKGVEVSNMIDLLLTEQWLHEVDVPPKLRAVNSKKAFLVNLTTQEHEAVLRGEPLPAAKLVIPKSWQKAEIPLCPEKSDFATNNVAD